MYCVVPQLTKHSTHILYSKCMTRRHLVYYYTLCMDYLIVLFRILKSIVSLCNRTNTKGTEACCVT